MVHINVYISLLCVFIYFYNKSIKSLKYIDEHIRVDQPLTVITTKIDLSNIVNFIYFISILYYPELMIFIILEKLYLVIIYQFVVKKLIIFDIYKLLIAIMIYNYDINYIVNITTTTFIIFLDIVLQQ